MYHECSYCLDMLFCWPFGIRMCTGMGIVKLVDILFSHRERGTG